MLCTPREGIYGVAAGQRQGRSSGNEPRAGKDNEGIESRSCCCFKGSFPNKLNTPHSRFLTPPHASEQILFPPHSTVLLYKCQCCSPGPFPCFKRATSRCKLVLGFKAADMKKAQRDQTVTCTEAQRLRFSRGSYQRDESGWMYLCGVTGL